MQIGCSFVARVRKNQPQSNHIDGVVDCKSNISKEEKQHGGEFPIVEGLIDKKFPSAAFPCFYEHVYSEKSKDAHLSIITDEDLATHVL